MRVFHKRRKIGPSVSPDATSQAVSASAAAPAIGLSGVDWVLEPACCVLLCDRW